MLLKYAYKKKIYIYICLCVFLNVSIQYIVNSIMNANLYIYIYREREIFYQRLVFTILFIISFSINALVIYPQYIYVCVYDFFRFTIFLIIIIVCECVCESVWGGCFFSYAHMCRWISISFLFVFISFSVRIVEFDTC